MGDLKDQLPLAGECIHDLDRASMSLEANASPNSAVHSRTVAIGGVVTRLVTGVAIIRARI
jgi:hypothetical protein